MTYDNDISEALHALGEALMSQDSTGLLTAATCLMQLQAHRSHMFRLVLIAQRLPEIGELPTGEQYLEALIAALEDQYPTPEKTPDRLHRH